MRRKTYNQHNKIYRKSLTEQSADIKYSWGEGLLGQIAKHIDELNTDGYSESIKDAIEGGSDDDSADRNDAVDIL